MATQTLICPYCNASLGIQAGWSAGQRIVCPRCGDSFALRFSDSFTDQPALSHSPETRITTEVPAEQVLLPSRWSNRLVAGMVIGLMLFMAGGGLVFMLITQQQRRAYDTNRPPRRPGKQRSVPEEESVPPVVSVAPDKLAALGYLPSGVNFLIAARIPELLATPLGTQLLHEPLKFGELQLRLENLSEWVGFRTEQIDHFVFAARIDESVPPPFSVVFRTARPFDEAELRQRIKGTRIPSPSKKKTLYSFRVPQLDVQVNAWLADQRTVVLSLFADQLERLPTQPVEDLQQLPQELRTVLKQRREPVAPVWTAGHSRDWSKTWAAPFLNRMKKEDFGRIKPLRTFGIWIVPNESPVVKGVFACKDEPGARGLEDYFRSLGGPDVNLKTALDGSWLTLQFQPAPDFLTRMLKR